MGFDDLPVREQILHQQTACFKNLFMYFKRDRRGNNTLLKTINFGNNQIVIKIKE